MRARASRDVDLSIPQPFEQIPLVLDAVLAVGFDQFTVRRHGTLLELDRVHAYRGDLEVRYAGRSLYRLDLDINSAQFEPSVDVVPSGVLTELGLPGPVHVALLDVSAQLVQKLHGATQPSINGYKNERYRDVIDSLIIADSSQLDLEWVRIAAEAEFFRRGTHGWPPSFILDARWRNGLRAEALAHGSFMADPDQISDAFNTLIERIEYFAMYNDVETEVLEVLTNQLTNEAKPGGTLGAKLAQGFRIREINQDLSNHPRLFLVLERQRLLPRTVRGVPRLQTRLEMLGPPAATAVTPFAGTVRNFGTPANYVRLILPGVAQDYMLRSTTRFGTIAQFDEIVISIQASTMQGVVTGGVQELSFEYEDDAGQKYRQVGALEPYASFDNTRVFQAMGIGPALPIERYSVPYAP